MKYFFLVFLFNYLFANSIDALYHLNQIRMNSGLNTFQINEKLNNSSKNHTNYLIKNKTISHDEIPLKFNFTGITPSDRAVKSGYNTNYVGENLTAGILGYKNSIDQLMTAIYHRITFLHFNYNEIGMYSKDNITVFNLGNSNINYHCSTGETKNPKYKTNICKNKNKLSTYEYNSFFSVQNKNPEYVVFPSVGSINNMTAFYDETPDPLPDRIVSGNPVSIHFNNKKVKKIEMEYFKIFDGYREIKNTRILTSKNDPNNIIDNYTFVLFPLDRLEWGKSYSVKFKGKKDGFSFYKEWTFHTKSLNGQIIDVLKNNKRLWKNTNYNLYFNPEDFGRLKTIKSNCSYLEIIDYNTINLKSNHSCFIQVRNKKFNFKFY